MGRYEDRLLAQGKTARERALNKFVRDINTKAPKNLSCKEVKINGEDRNLVINTGTQPYYKKYMSMPNEVVYVGDYVDFADSKWIVVTADNDSEVYVDGQMHQCNYLLKWQDSKGDIIERWCEIKSASKYNDGENGDGFITLGSDQLSVTLPADEDTIKLKKEMRYKFFIDMNKENPTVYELTGTGNVTNFYNGHGVCEWIVKECAYTATEEEIRLGVCNYSAKDEPTDTTATITPIIECAKKSIKYGSSRTFTASFMDDYGNYVEETPMWSISNCSFVDKLTILESYDTIKISITRDEDLLGETFDLSLTSDNSETVTMTIEITE